MRRRTFMNNLEPQTEPCYFSSTPPFTVFASFPNSNLVNFFSRLTPHGLKSDTKMKSLKGKPKSGRIWKSDKKRKSEMINVKALHTSWSKKKKLRAEQESIKTFEKELKDAAKQEKENKRKLIEERKKRREENIRKAEIVQEIKNTSKLKRLKKKQLRMIEKR